MTNTNKQLDEIIQKNFGDTKWSDEAKATILELISMSQLQLLTEIKGKAETRYGEEIGTGETFHFVGVPVSVLDQYISNNQGE